MNDLASTQVSRLVDCSRLVGQQFCDALVEALAETIDVPTVLMARMIPDRPGWVRTVSAWSSGRLAPEFEYPLRGSPCQQVMKDSTCLYPDDVVDLFPDDQLLVDMGARGYLGAPLINYEGRVIGVLAAVGDKPLAVKPEMRSLFEIFAGRAAAEMDREGSASRSEYLGRLIDGSMSEFYVFDADTLRFVLVNEGARKNLGYTMAELETMTPLELKPDFTRAEFLSTLEPLCSGNEQVVSFRTRHLRKDGTLYPVAVKLQKISDFGLPVFYAAIEDITHRETVLTQLEEAQQRLQRLFSQSPAGIVEADEQGRMTLVNPTWCEMLGYSEAELLNMTLFNITDPNSLPQTMAALEELAAGSDGVTVEKNYLRKDGTPMAALSNVSALRSGNGEFLGIVAVVSDVTDRLRAEERVRESEARLRKILDGTLAFVGVLDLEGSLLEANAAAISSAGLSRADVIGKKFWDCEWWSYDPVVAAKLKESVAHAAKGNVVRYDETIWVKDDGRVTIDFMLTPFIAEDGSVELLVPSGVDITERKRQEVMLHELMREVNHRSKNILAVVQAIARQMPATEPEIYKRELGERLRSLALCQDVLVNNGWQNVGMSQLLESQLSHLGDMVGSRIHLSGPNILVSPTEAQGFGMAVYELTTNATKYGALSNESGVIEVTWDVMTNNDSSRLHFHWRERGGPTVVEPTGSGFGSKVLSKLVPAMLNGTTAATFPPEGFEWQIDCVIETLTQKQGGGAIAQGRF